MKLPLRAWKKTLSALGFTVRPRSATKAPKRAARALRFESLEERAMMAVLYFDPGGVKGGDGHRRSFDYRPMSLASARLL